MSFFHPDLRFTYRDYCQLPEDRRCELIEGDCIMVPAPSPAHQEIVIRLLLELREHVSREGLGRVLMAPCDVYLSRHDVVQPDILFIGAQRQGMIEEKLIRGAPDLLVEVLSSSSQARDREMKRKLYGRFGVREYWLVDPERRRVEILTRQENQSLGTRDLWRAGCPEIATDSRVDAESGGVV